MKTKIKFKVTKNDIKNGSRCCPFHCPVALALKRNKKIYTYEEAWNLYNGKAKIKTMKYK
jgi:hypothetical protein